MKVALLTISFWMLALVTRAQDVPSLPKGRYESTIRNNGKWEKGDIQLLDDSHYRLGNSGEGEYRFSATSQRVFFTSGPLKGVFAKTTTADSTPTILIPLNENQQLGLKMASADVLAQFRN